MAQSLFQQTMHVVHRRRRQASGTVSAAAGQGLGVHLGDLRRLEFGEHDSAERGDQILSHDFDVPLMGARADLGFDCFKPSIQELRHRRLVWLKVGSAAELGNQPGAFGLRFALRPSEGMPTALVIALETIDQITGGKLGTHDVPCPVCGPHKSSLAKQRKPTMRVYRTEPNFASYFCVRCGEKGTAIDRRRAPADPSTVARTHAEVQRGDDVNRSESRRLARWLWRQRQPLPGSIGERYMRRRGYHGTLPATLGFLPASGEHHPSIIAAFGLTRELQPGIIEIAEEAVLGVHLIKLRPDGNDRLRDVDIEPKVTIGRAFVAPITIAAPNDLLGLCIAEGIEDALNAYQASGLGAWAAGSASRMPALADAVPSYIEGVTILVDDNDAGHKGSLALAGRLYARGIEVLLTPVTKG
jgi:hypothetical protein